MSLLEVKEISKSYENFKLQEVSFTLPKGYVMGYVGQNGAGKTTTINLITRLCNAEQGEVRIDGITYEEDPHGYKEKIGYVGDESYFPREFKIKDIRSVMQSMYESFQVEKFDELVKKWNLSEKQKIREFSKGMKVKLMFATVLSRDTRLLILDEVTNGLNPVMREEILQLLQTYIEDGEHSIFFSTHLINDLEQIADYIVFLHQGKILMNASKDDMLESFLLIKGDSDKLTEEQTKRLIGITKGEYGFTALIKTNDAILFDNEFIKEKPTIDQIMVHEIKNGGM